MFSVHGYYKNNTQKTLLVEDVGAGTDPTFWYCNYMDELFN